MKWLVSFAKRRSREVRLEFDIRYSVLGLVRSNEDYIIIADAYLIGYRAFMLT